MEFDRLTIVLLILRSDAPELDEEASAALQDAHLRHLADLHEAGHLVAAGPLDDEEYRGLSIFNVEPDEARELSERDPGRPRGSSRDQGHPLDASCRRGGVHARAIPTFDRRGTGRLSPPLQGR